MPRLALLEPQPLALVPGASSDVGVQRVQGLSHHSRTARPLVSLAQRAHWKNPTAPTVVQPPRPPPPQRQLVYRLQRSHTSRDGGGGGRGSVPQRR